MQQGSCRSPASDDLRRTRSVPIVQALEAANPSPSARKEIPEVLICFISIQLSSNKNILTIRRFLFESFFVDAGSFQLGFSLVCSCWMASWSRLWCAIPSSCHGMYNAISKKSFTRLHQSKHVSFQQHVATYQNPPRPKNPFEIDDDRFQVQAPTVSIYKLSFFFSHSNLHNVLHFKFMMKNTFGIISTFPISESFKIY